MKIIKIFITILILFYFSPLKADEDRLQNNITKNLRCLICQGQSVYDSDSEFAISLKLVVRNKIKEGLSEDQIYNFLSEKYGEWILYDPKFNKNTYFLWFLPLLIFLFGGAIIFKKLIKISEEMMMKSSHSNIKKGETIGSIIGIIVGLYIGYYIFINNYFGLYDIIFGWVYILSLIHI